MSPRGRGWPSADRISALPDELLCHILSFLPTKLAFTTTILSKRWTSLCRSLASLNVCYEGSPRDEHEVCGFVRDAVSLIPRGQHQSTKKLVVCNLLEPLIRVDIEATKWQHGVEGLKIYTTSCATLSPNIFRCQTLVCLKLSRISKVGKISTVDLPSLKSLHLFEVSFHNEKEDYRKFLNGAPILEDLYVAETSNSRSVHVVGTKTSNLVKAHLRPCIPNPLYFSRFKEYFSSPKFPNLIHLEFVFYCIPFSGWPTVLGMLRHCPRLQNLVIKKRSLEKQSYIETEEYSYAPVPECVSSHLRTCFIGSILNVEDDFRFAAYIIKNAKFLETMNMCSCQLSPEDEYQIVEKLSILPRISIAFSISTCWLNHKTSRWWRCWSNSGEYRNIGL